MRTVTPALGLVAVLALAAPAAAQTWTGAAADGGNWNNAANWADPGQVPNSATADVVFGPSAVSTVSIPAVFQVRSFTFASGTNNYTLAVPLQVGNKWLTNLQSITVSDAVTTTQTISLGGDPTGSLLFAGSGPATLMIANNALPTAAGSPTLLIGPFTSIGTPGSGGITVTGTGTTTISGSFATNASANQVIGGLTKSGPGTLTLSGDGSNLIGGLTLSGGTLRLDYSTNTASKLGGGGLTSRGGDLVLVPAGAAITQNLGSTTLTTGHTAISAQPGAGFQIGLGGIIRTTGATLDLSPGGANLFATTSTGNTNGLLGTGSAGTGPAFATVGGLFWAAASGGSIVGITGTLGNYGPGFNSDIGGSPSFPAAITTNSLRFTANGQTVNQNGFDLTLQSGGILLPSNVDTGTIAGGNLLSIREELIAHVYGTNLTIGSAIVAGIGLTKTGPGTLTLAGDNVGLNGPVNVNRGHLRVTSPLAIDTLTAINFNDTRTGQALQTFTVQVGDNTNASTYAAIRLSAYSAPGTTEATVFSSGTSQSSRVTLGGVIASAPGAVTPLRITGFINDTSGFNLTGANTFTGTVNLIEGTLGINSNTSLGNPANALILDTFNNTAGGLEFLTGGIDVTRPVTILRLTRVVSNGTDVNTISGPVTGGRLVKDGTGTLVLTNPGNAGTREVRGGTLQVAAGALGTTGNLFLDDGITLAVTGNNSFATPRVLILGSAPGPATATVDVAANQTFTVAAMVANNTGSTGTLVKTGAGTLALTGTVNAYTGGTVVRAGTVQAAADGSLGAAAAPVTVDVAGQLTYTGTTTTARTFNLNGGTLEAPAGVTLTLDGAAVNGGFLRGAGAVELTGGAALTGVTTFNSTTLNQTGPASYRNFTNGSVLTVAAGLAAPVSMSGFINRGGGTITVGAGSQVNAADFESSGVVILAPGTMAGPTQVTNAGTSPLFFNGGSRTFIGTAATTAQFAAGIDLNGRNAVVAGGLLVNNGFIVDSAAGAPGRVIADFGSLVKGAGFYQGPVVTQNGGRFQAGNSPGTASFGEFTFGPGGVDQYVFSIYDADGGAGQAWGLVKAERRQLGSAATSGDFLWTADPGHKLTVVLETLLGSDESGPMADFDPNRSYTWPAVQWAGAYTGPVDAASLAAATAFDTSDFLNPVGGVFGWTLDTGSQSLSLTYTPVPEPGTLALAGVAAAGWVTVWRRRRRSNAHPSTRTA